MSRSPNFILKGLDKMANKKSGKLGAAWVNDDGTLTLVLDAGVGIFYNPNIVYTLFPNEEKKDDRLDRS